MGKFIFKLPDIGEGTVEAELVAWRVKVGDDVKEDQPLAEIMTDKATVEITSPNAGRVVALHGEVGAAIQVGSPFVEFETSEPRDSLRDISASAPDAAVQSTPGLGVDGAAPSTPRPERPKASPALRRKARELGVVLEDMRGTGPDGRILQTDLDNHIASRAAAAGEIDFTEEKLIGLRRKIAGKMELSARRIPHFAYVESVDVTELEKIRASLNEQFKGARPKLTFLPFLIRALVELLPNFPQINATFDDENGIVRKYRAIHLGVATQTDNGLMVPVIRNAQALGLWELAAEVTRLAAAARDGSATRGELSGSTITTTSLGALGGIVTTPLINHPEVAIIGPNRIEERPVVIGGHVAIRKMMNISSSFDHRIVDGHDAATFIQQLKMLIEQPALFLD